MTSECVVLISDSGSELGSALKSEVHTTSTPLHLGFSCYLLDASGRLLLTRRALSKRTWPGVWTNSFCGHPSPGEPIESAVMRRAEHELGAQLSSLVCVLPHFRYRAVDAGGTEENEWCPVYAARLGSDLHPRPSEVEEWAWVDPLPLTEASSRMPFVFSPWMVEQLPRLVEAGVFEDGRT